MRPRHNQSGYAMIMVICMMAIVIALAMSMLLLASSVLSSAQSESRQEQCRVLTVSLSEQIERELTASEFLFGSEDEELAAADDSLWFYLKDQITSGAWPYFNEDERGHTARYAHRTFSFSPESVPAAVEAAFDPAATIELLAYWESENGAELDGLPFVVQVTCTLGKQSCTITSEYMLSISQLTIETVDEELGETVLTQYNQWKWSLNWRE